MEYGILYLLRTFVSLHILDLDCTSKKTKQQNISYVLEHSLNMNM